MSPIRIGFRIPFCLSFTGLLALIFLTACQPLIQAQTGTQTQIPVITPRKGEVNAPANQNQTKGPASTTLTAEDITAVPLHKDTRSGEHTGNKADSEEAEQPAVKIDRSSQPEKSTTKTSFNPADLVGRSHTYVKAQFGKADFERTEGIIHVLQYRQPECVIDLFISIANSTDAAPSSDAKILGWAMRERTINKQLNQTLCQQQFYERKL